MAERTPTPWRTHGVYPDEIYATVDDKRFMVADVCGVGSQDQDRANAAFIVRAVNNHDTLVKALQEIADLGAKGETSARLGNIAHAALISVGRVNADE